MTVTVWAVFQLLLSKLREFVDNVPSVLSIPSILMLTGLLGWAVRATVKVVCPPASVVLPVSGVTVIPAVSLSVLVMLTVLFNPLKLLSVLLDVRSTVKVVCPSASVVLPVSGVTVIPAMSLSVLVMLTVVSDQKVAQY